MALRACIAFAFLLLLLQDVQCNGDWVRIAKPKPDYEIKVTFAIKQTNPGWLEQKLKEVSYPSSPQYGEYLNFDEIAVHVHGRPESVNALMSALDGVGIGSESVDFTLGMDFAVVRMRIETAEKLFNADFYEFQHKEKSEFQVVKSLDFVFPAVLDGHLDFVHGVTNFPTPNKVVTRKYGKVTKPLQDLHTPDSIAKDYNTSGYVSTNPNNSQATAGFLNESFSPKDLQMFQEKYNVPINPIAKVVGMNNASNPSVEPSIDLDCITGTGRNVTTWFVATNRQEPMYGFDNMLYWIMGQVNDTKSPWVHSVSYGVWENQINSTMAGRTDKEFMKFGVSGRTVLICTMDNGVDCQFDQYHPWWPGSSPSVTSVGGTTSLDTVWSRGGGGFSNLYPAPDYQKDAIKAYLSSGKAPPTKYFNTSGRGYPDVAAFSVDIPIILNGSTVTYDGTSCSTPIFAALIASLNDIRLNNGKKTLGFLNPLLYQTLKGKGFFDVTQGANDGYDPSCGGFKATTGWDPASGWGNPNFGILRDLV